MGCYWRSEFPILIASTPIPSVAFLPKSFKKLLTITAMRIEFLKNGDVSIGIKVVWKVELFV